MQLSDGVECVGSFSDCSTVQQDMESLKPSLVLMDIEMPNVNGIEGVKKIKRSFPEIKIVMQTVFEDEEKIFAGIIYLFTFGLFGIGWIVDIIRLAFKPNPYRVR